MPVDIIAELLKYEGGFTNDPDDHGGATNFGITAADLGRWRTLGRKATVDEVRGLTVAEAQAIYQQWYVDAPGFAQIGDEDLRWVLVDTGVLHGTRTAIRWLQTVLGVTVDGVIGAQTSAALAAPGSAGAARGVLAVRIRRYVRIITDDKSQLRFLGGWINRATSILERI